MREKSCTGASLARRRNGLSACGEARDLVLCASAEPESSVAAHTARRARRTYRIGVCRHRRAGALPPTGDTRPRRSSPRRGMLPPRASDDASRVCAPPSAGAGSFSWPSRSQQSSRPRPCVYLSTVVSTWSNAGSRPRLVAGAGPTSSAGAFAASTLWQQTAARLPGPLVAVIDTGVAPTPDLAGRLEAGQSFVGGVATADENGHGTAVAGIVAGASGVCPTCRILPLRVSAGAGGTASSEDIAAAVDAAVAARCSGHQPQHGRDVSDRSGTGCRRASCRRRRRRCRRGRERCLVHSHLPRVVSRGAVGRGRRRRRCHCLLLEPRPLGERARAGVRPLAFAGRRGAAVLWNISRRAVRRRRRRRVTRRRPDGNRRPSSWRRSGARRMPSKALQTASSIRPAPSSRSAVSRRFRRLRQRW